MLKKLLKRLIKLNRSNLVFTFCLIFFLVSCAFYAYSYFSTRMNQSLMGGLRSCAQVTNGDNALIACTRELVKQQLEKHSTVALVNEVSTGQVPKAYGDCHSVAHIIGQQTYKKYKNMEKALTQCTDQCFSGCLHGVMGEAMTEKLGTQNPDIDISHMDAGQIEDIGKKYCKSIYDLEICHGIGHILFAVTGDFKKASQSCSLISKGLFLDECVTGVYMQGIGGVQNTLVLGKEVPESAKVPDGDYGYPCNTIPQSQEQYRRSCFKYLPPYQEILYAKNNITDPKEKLAVATKACKTLREPDRSYCFEGVGKFMPFYVEKTGTSTEGLISICTNLPKESDKESCIFGHIRVLRSYKHDVTALAFCTTMSSKDLQHKCFTSFFSYYGLNYAIDKDQACKDAPGKELCAIEYASFLKDRPSLQGTVYDSGI